MGDDKKRLEAQSEEDSQAILSRREFLIKSTLVGMGAAVVAACGSGDKTQPQACLSVALDEETPTDALSDQPQICLEPLPPDMSDALDDDLPQPCLTPRLEDAQTLDSPAVCLSIAIDADDGDSDS